MIQIDDDIVFEDLLTHIGEQRLKARIIDEPFDLGIATDKKPSQILKVVDSKLGILKDMGLNNYKWHADALRSEFRLAGENLLISICRPR